MSKLFRFMHERKTFFGIGLLFCLLDATVVCHGLPQPVRFMELSVWKASRKLIGSA